MFDVLIDTLVSSFEEYKLIVNQCRREHKTFCLQGICSDCGKSFEKKFTKKEVYTLCKGCASKYGLIKSNGSLENATKRRLETTKQTCLEKYNCEFPTQTKDVKEKIRKTFSQRYGENITNPSQIKKVRDKIKQTNLIRYGEEEYFKSKDCKEKTKTTSLKKYGTGSPNSSTVVKEHKVETFLKSFGVTNPNKTSEVQEKINTTCLQRYGKRWNVYKYYYDNNKFDSSWELKLYIFLKDNNIPFQFHPIEYITEYYIDGHKHYYEPDFLIDGRIYEVKGSHFFDKDGDLIDIYGDKHKCIEKQNAMRELNVIILTEKSDLLKSAFEYFDSLHFQINTYKEKK